LLAKADVCVIGAGIIGITTALELQDRGAEVVLLDRGQPGMQTSFGNAGVISASTVLNVNNPALFRNLPSLITGRSPYFSYDLRYAVSRLPWLIKFLRYGRKRHTDVIANSLQALQSLSAVRHDELVAEAGIEQSYSKSGWLKVFRSERGFDSSELERQQLSRLNIPYERLCADALAKAEPGLRPAFHSGLLLSSTRSVLSPHLMCKNYLDLFHKKGGRTELFDVHSIKKRTGSRWTIGSDTPLEIESKDVVIAAGPWCDDVCGLLGYDVPLAWERGYHVNVTSPSPGLTRPVCDVERGFVMAPQGETTRITTGVEFVHRDAWPNYSQVQRAYQNAKSAAPVGGIVDEKPWLGSRPTLPDGLPVIGQAPRHRGIWFNFGHQHIGMSTSTGSASILADAILGQSRHNMSRAFLPERFGI
jgi:D-amino-acid dehydrogenase